MFTYDFMQNAFAAAGIVAVLCGLVGFFLVLRSQTFAGHALSHVGFAGATGAVLIGVSPLWGLLVMTMVAGIGMGLLGDRLQQRDVAIGMVLAMSLGLGLLFLNFYTAYATQVTTLLFGNVLAIDRRDDLVVVVADDFGDRRPRRNGKAVAVRQSAARTGRGEGVCRYGLSRCCSSASSRLLWPSARRSSGFCWCSR